ncbi:MAG: glycosyltransferase family 4 protein [Planctomycetota bacterium]|jgi:glycosyltransferase involved in cell wall biosynthesis
MRIFYFAGFDLGSSECGKTSHVEGVVYGLHRLGWEVTLFSCKDQNSTIQRTFPFPHVLIKRKNHLLKHQIFDQIRLAWKLFWWKDTKPEVIYIRNRLTMLVPVLYAIIHRVPFFYEINGLKQFETSHKSLVNMALKIENWVLRHAKGILPVTSELKEHYSQRTKISENKFKVISNGADVNLWQPNVYFINSNDKTHFTIGFLGHFHPRQGAETIIKALPSIRDQIGNVRLVLAGSGEKKEEYQRLTADLGLSKYVDFTGYIKKENIASVVAGFDIAVAPYTSEFGETQTGLSPLKIFTYLACERLVVASDLSGLQSFSDCPAIFFAKADDSQDFAMVIVEALKRDHSERISLGKQGRQYVLDGYSWDQIAQKITKHIEKVIEK